MSVVLEHRHRLLHVRALLAKWIRRRTRNSSSTLLTSFRFPITTSRKCDPTGTATGRSQGITSTSSRIRSRRSARKEISWVFTTGSSVMRDSARTWMNWVAVKNMPWDGQIGERRPHAPRHCRGNSSLSKKLVDPFKYSWFRYDASKASTWLQASIVNHATAQKPRGYSSSAKMAKLFLILLGLARFLVAFFISVSPWRWTQHWSIGETWWTDWANDSWNDSQH